jgi:hypothetical protein
LLGAGIESPVFLCALAKLKSPQELWQDWSLGSCLWSDTRPMICHPCQCDQK